MNIYIIKTSIFLILINSALLSNLHNLYAQATGTGGEDVKLFVDGGIDSSGDLTMVTTKELMPITIGNIYLFSEWVNNVELALKTNKRLIIRNLNYNIQKDKFEIKISKDSVFTLDSNYIDYIVVEGRNFKKLEQVINSKGFYEIVFFGNNFSIVKKNNLRLIKGKLNPLDGSVEPNKYYAYQDYYLNRDNNRLIKFNLKRKAVLSLFKEDKEKKLINYVNKNRFSYKKEKDLIKIFKYVDSL